MNINGFIWSIADDVLYHVYDRTKYRDIILPMTVIRRLDAVLDRQRSSSFRPPAARNCIASQRSA